MLHPKFWVKYSLLILLIIGILSYFLRVNDPAIGMLEAFLLGDETVREYVGEMRKYQVLSTRYVSDADDINRYHEYKIKVHGSKGEILLKVRADSIHNGKGWAYSIVQNYSSN